MAEDLLLRLSARAGAFAFLDAPSKIEALAMGSFSCCMLGSLSHSFPLAANLSIALLALLAIRGRSEAQLAGLCGFCLFTTLTDIINLCYWSTGWAGTMTILNIFIKLSMASYAYRICDALAADDVLPSADDYAAADAPHGAGSSGGYPAVYHSPPLKEEDADDAPPAANEAGQREGVTRYRAI